MSTPMPDKSKSAWRARIDLWATRLHRARYVLATAAILLLSFALFGALSFLDALLALAAIAVAALIERSQPPSGLPALAPPKRSTLDLADPHLEAILAGLPDPVI